MLQMSLTRSVPLNQATRRQVPRVNQPKMVHSHVPSLTKPRATCHGGWVSAGHRSRRLCGECVQNPLAWCIPYGIISRAPHEKHLQHATAAAEVTRDRNQKAQSAEKEGGRNFWVHEIKHDGFRLMICPAALSTRRLRWAADTLALAFAGLAAANASPTIRARLAPKRSPAQVSPLYPR